MRKSLQFYLGILAFSLLISTPLIIPFFHRGFFTTDDGGWMIIRLSAFYQALADGQIPARFLSRLNFGYGYPVSNFLYPGFLYIGAILHLIGFGFVNSIKIILITCLVGSAIFTYFWLSSFFKKTAVLVGVIFYLYLPYHLFDVYKRGSVGELLALMIIPFILWVIEVKNIFLLSFSLFLLILSHNSLALLFLPIIFLYALIRKSFPVPQLILSFSFSILMSSFFIFPAVYELGLTVFNVTKISDFNQYFSTINIISIPAFAIVILCLILLLNKILKKELKNNSVVLYMFALSVISLFLSQSVSLWIWNSLPSEIIQFPFRLLSVFIVAVSFLAAFFINELKNKPIRISFSLLLIILLGLSSVSYFNNLNFINNDDDYYSTNEATTTVKDEYMPKWVKEKPSSHYTDKVELIKGEAQITNLVYNNRKTDFDVNAGSSSVLQINTIYYPGWQITDNNQRILPNYNNKYGVMDIEIPKGKHFISATFSETPLRLASDLISVFCLIILLIFAGLKLKKTS